MNCLQERTHTVIYLINGRIEIRLTCGNTQQIEGPLLFACPSREVFGFKVGTCVLRFIILLSATIYTDRAPGRPSRMNVKSLFWPILSKGSWDCILETTEAVLNVSQRWHTEP